VASVVEKEVSVCLLNKSTVKEAKNKGIDLCRFKCRLINSVNVSENDVSKSSIVPFPSSEIYGKNNVLMENSF